MSLQEQPAVEHSLRDLVPLFVAESSDCLDQAESALLELESNATAIEPVNVVFRAFHTIKSTSAFLGFDEISTLAHDVESLLSEVRDGQAEFTRSVADKSLAATQKMRELLGGVSATQTEPVEDSTPAPAAESWVRVRTERLDQLLDLVGELVVAHSIAAQDETVQRDRHGALARKVQHTSKIVRELQSLSLSLRMVPLRGMFQKLQLLVRDVGHTTEKPVQLLTDGDETEIDRNMVEVLADPLIHMIRNAIDHGIESVAERVAAGKPAIGTLRLRASHVGGNVVVELSDDGRGLDEARIMASAVAKRVIENGRDLSSAEIHELIFHPGLSTASDVTELSGRGVGMDVVRRNIEALHGRVEIASGAGRGTTFTIRLPLTLAITDGMIVRAGGERYIVPTAAIHTSFRPQRESLAAVGGDGELVTLHGNAIPIVRLHHVLGIDNAITDPTQGLLVVLGENGKRYALLVDDLLGQQQFVAKPVATGMAPVAGIAGGAILGDGRVGLILDSEGLFAAARRLPTWRRAHER